MSTRPAVTLPDERWAAAVALLRGCDEVVLACHVGPDGDALGSMLGLGLALRHTGTRVLASWGSDPFEVPAHYAFLPGQDLLVPPAALPSHPALLVTFDTASRDRLGVLSPLVDAASAVLVVDHHASNGGFGTVDLVDPDAAASAVVVEELVRRLGVPLDADIAACLYTGLTTDTGSFRFAATTPAVHELAARLLETGVAHDEIARAVWDTNRFAYLRLLGTTLSRAVLDAEHSLVWSVVPHAALEAHDVAVAEVEGVIDALRTAAEAEVALVVKPGPDGRYAASLRSKGGVDVGALAVSQGGGGHRFAAGFSADGRPEDVVEQVKAALRALRSQQA